MPPLMTNFSIKRKFPPKNLPDNYSHCLSTVISTLSTNFCTRKTHNFTLSFSVPFAALHGKGRREIYRALSALWQKTGQKETARKPEDLCAVSFSFPLHLEFARRRLQLCGKVRQR
ncbi:MAG: hypothetical protein IKZ66_00370, partial [Schwartzia sp.]|nr:hypothetical protein [Schwartzia sp. (in: firmicutes)]